MLTLNKKRLLISIIVLIISVIIGLIYMNRTIKLDTNYLVESPNIEEIDMSNKKINIYFFWGEECPHCEELKQFLLKNKKRISKKANIYTFEIWNHPNNANIYFNFNKHFGNPTANLSVPYLVIGEKEIKGYSNKSDDYIIKTINQQYKNRKKIDKFKDLLKQ